MSEEAVISPSLLENIDMNEWIDPNLFDLCLVGNEFMDDESELFAAACQLLNPWKPPLPSEGTADSTSRRTMLDEPYTVTSVNE